jgi:N-acylneuraminate cytidylyltransferase
MVNGHKVISMIPARGGSKSIPYKNITPLGGKPLLAWSIEVAHQTTEIDRVIVSTDDEIIAKTALEWGAEVYQRPTKLATDKALVIDAIRDLINTLKEEGENIDIMVLLEPTCPLRSANDVRQCIHRVAEDHDSAATFKVADLNPHRAWRIKDGKPEPFIPGTIPWLPRQMLPDAYQLNGAVYAFRASLLSENSKGLLFGKQAAVIMPPERSVDIDGALDIIIAEAIVQKSGWDLGGK